MTFDPPASWRRSIHPRRGGVPAGYMPTSEALPDSPHGLDRFEHPATPPDIAAAARATLTGADPSPLGAAALAASRLAIGKGQVPGAAIADDWITRHGVTFAARAAAELPGLWVAPRDLSHGVQVLRPLGRLGDGGNEEYAYSDTFVVERVLGQVRAALATAPDEDYAAVLRELEAARAGSLCVRFATSFLAPAQAEWVEQDVRALEALAVEQHSHAMLLMAAVGTVEQAQRVQPWLHFRGESHLYDAVMVHTLAEALGDGVLDVYRTSFQGQSFGAADFWRVMHSTLAAIPTDRAFAALLDRVEHKGVQAAIAEAADRFPERAMRMLQAAATRPSPLYSELLRRHAARHPDLAPEHLRPAGAPVSGEAPAAALPPVLAAPPWTTRRKAAKPVVLAELRCADEPAMAWATGERERLLARLPRGQDVHPSVEEAVAQVHAGTIRDWTARDLFRFGPEEVVRPLLDVYRPGKRHYGRYWMPEVAARFGVAAYGLLVHAARQQPGDGALLMPYTSPEIALLIADWHARLKAARRIALTWLRTHPDAAARALVPAALGRAGQQRRQAGQALLALAAAGHRETVLAAAAGYGAEAAAATRDLLDADPLLQLPARIPQPPDWADPAVLPEVRLRGGAGTLPADAVRHLLTMLMMSKLGEAYAGLEHVRAACEPDDLARFAWELLLCWEAADAPPEGSWALDAQAVLGDDGTAQRLAAAVRRWPYEGAHKRAAGGLDALAHLGTDAALRQLHEIATKMKAKAVRTRAEQNLNEIADVMGLTPDQLADRLVPHFDLGPDATRVLDYGPRRFTAGFDEQLRPYVTEEDGTRRKELPAPAARDDDERAAEAREWFSAARKGVRKVVPEQVRRLERALADGRAWSAAEFRQVLLAHPLLWQLARRLVWVAAGGTGTLAVRLAEDHTFATVDDDAVELPADAVLRIAHPVELDVPAWVEVFADYGILQPFPQLAREVHRLTGEEAAAVRLARFDGHKALSVKLINLEHRGWRREGREGGYQSRMERDLPGGRVLIVDLDPGIMLGVPAEEPEQRYADVWICPPEQSTWADKRTVPFGELDPRAASEILRDLESCL